MNNATSKFPFTSTGVDQWQTGVTQGGPSSIDLECGAIASNFAVWIESRFVLREDQMVFVDELDPLMIESYSAALRYALQNSVPIELDKEETALRKELNPKVIIMEEKIERWRNSIKQGSAQTGDHLIFRIFYP